MFYIIIPIDAGDTPESWYAYLQKAGPIIIYKNKPKAKEEQQVVLFRLSKEGVLFFDDSQCFNKENKTLDFSRIPQNQIKFKWHDDSPDFSLSRLSTQDFFHRAWELGVNYRDQSLELGKRTYYLLHSSSFRDPPVSISRYPKGREVLYYNPSSLTLQDCYDGLQTLELQKNPTEDLQPNLQCLAKFVGGVFEHREAEQVKRVVDEPTNKKIKLEGENAASLPAVNLTRFINEGVGVCRHNAMLVCYLLNRMKSDDWLPEGEIIPYRMVLKSGIGHSFVLFQTADKSEIYVIDSTAPAVFSLPEMQEKFKKRYGQDIYFEIKERFLVFTPCQATAPLDNEDFLSPSNSKL